jgi:hypothetical protein
LQPVDRAKDNSSLLAPARNLPPCREALYILGVSTDTAETEHLAIYQEDLCPLFFLRSAQTPKAVPRFRRLDL